MNVIKKILLAFTIVFALAGCGDNVQVLGPAESIEHMKKAESYPKDAMTPIYMPYMSDEDIYFVKMYGGITDLTYSSGMLKTLWGTDLSNYNPPTVNLDKFMLWFWIFIGFLVVLVEAYNLVRAFIAGSKDRQQEGAGGKELSRANTNILVFLISGFISAAFAHVIVSIPAATANAVSANIVNISMNSDNQKYATENLRFNRSNDIAEVLMMRKIEEINTSNAKAVRYAYHMIGSDIVLDGNSRATTFSEFAEYQTKLRGIEYATNINRTVTWIDLAFSWGVIGAATKLFNSEGYITNFAFYGKNNGGFFVNDILNFATSNFSIGIGKDVVETNDDFSTNENNSLERRNIIAAAMNYKGKVDIISSLNTVQGIVSASLTADDDSYITNKYESVYKAYKEDFVAAFRSVEPEIMKFESDAQRVEITSSALGLYAARLHGIDKDESMIRVYNWLDKPAIDWISVNCADSTFNYNIQKSALAALNTSSVGLYSDIKNWGQLNKACILPNGKKYDMLTMDNVNDIAAIKVKYINAKSHAQALKIVYNIINLAGKDAYREVVGDISNSNTLAFKKQLAGVVGLPMQLTEIINSKHSKEVSTNRIDNAVAYTYANATKDNNNFVDEVAVFGTPDNKNYVKESDQKEVLGSFREMKFAALFDNNSLATGNIASLNQYETNIKNGITDAIYDNFVDILSGPMDDALKAAGALPPNMSISEGLAYCKRTGCKETFKPSIYETVVISGKRFRDAGMKCLAAAAVAKGVNNLADIGGSVNAGGSAGVGNAANGAKLGGKVIKAATASAAAVAETVEMPCYIMVTTGFVNGDIMPMMFSVSLVFAYLGQIVLIYGLMFMLPISVLWDAVTRRHEMKVKVGKHFLGTFILSYVILAGTFLTFSVLLLPAYYIVRLLLDYGFGIEAGLIANIMSCLAVGMMLPLLFKYATNISKELTNTILQFLSIGVSNHAADSMNDGLVQTGMAAVTTGKIMQATRIMQAPINEFVQIKQRHAQEAKEIRAREMADAAFAARSQASSRADVIDEGKKRDTDSLLDPDFDKKHKDDDKKEDK